MLAAIAFSATAFAQSAPPKIGKGTKLWAGDCVASELRGTAPATETKPLSEQDIDAIPPGQKQ
jgi:hypothetical protein